MTVQNLKMLGHCGREEIDYYKLLVNDSTLSLDMLTSGTPVDPGLRKIPRHTDDRKILKATVTKAWRWRPILLPIFKIKRQWDSLPLKIAGITRRSWTTLQVHRCIRLIRNIIHLHRKQTESNYAQIRLPGYHRHPCSCCVHLRSHDQKTFAVPTPAWTQKVTCSRKFIWPPYELWMADICQTLQRI